MDVDAPRILQVTPTSYWGDGVVGGGERLAHYVDQALRRAASAAGIALTTSVLALDGSPRTLEVQDRFQAIPGRAWDAGSLDATVLRERLQQADIVYVHQCLCEVGLFVAAHARLLGKKVYGSDAGGPIMPLLRVNPDAIRVYDAVHAISEFAATAFRGFPVQAVVVPGPVDTELHHPRPSGGPAPDPSLVVAVGRILPHKGFERIIRALPQTLRLLVIGRHYDPDYLAFLRGCAQYKDVRFDDSLSDAAVREILCKARVFVHASTHVDYLGRFHPKPELLGLAPLEALAMGVPALVSDAGSLPELARLTGCRVFRDDAELSTMLHDVAAGASRPDAALMHAAVESAYGLRTAGSGLLRMMGIGA